jgi:hypothetical protein
MDGGTPLLMACPHDLFTNQTHGRVAYATRPVGDNKSIDQLLFIDRGIAIGYTWAGGVCHPPKMIKGHGRVANATRPAVSPLAMA